MRPVELIVRDALSFQHVRTACSRICTRRDSANSLLEKMHSQGLGEQACKSKTKNKHKCVGKIHEYILLVSALCSFAFLFLLLLLVFSVEVTSSSVIHACPSGNRGPRAL